MKSAAKLSIAFAAVMVQYASAENAAGKYNKTCPEGYSFDDHGICKTDCDEAISLLKESNCANVLGGGITYYPETDLTIQGCPYCAELIEPEENSEVDLETIYEDSEVENEEDGSDDDKSRLLRGSKNGCPKAYPKSNSGDICTKKKCKPLSVFCQRMVQPKPRIENGKFLQDCTECTETFGGETLKNGCPTEWPRKLKGKKKCAKKCDSVPKYCIEMHYGTTTKFNGYTLEGCPTCTKALTVNKNGCTDEFPKKIGKNRCGKENCPKIPSNCRKTEGPNKHIQEFQNAKDIVFEGCKICTATFDE